MTAERTSRFHSSEEAARPSQQHRARTVSDWLKRAAAELEAKDVPEPAANAEFIMASVLKAGRAELHLHAGRFLTTKQANHFWHLAQERARRVPLAYVLGTQPFMGFEIEVGREVMVPRPETEELVLEAARLLAPRAQEPLHLLEIGTGSGCISVALSALFPHATVYATDLSPAAIKLAMKNAETHHRSRHIRFIKEDLFKPEAAPRGWADLVISNPPYIPTSEVAGLAPEVLCEPRMALDGGEDGLDALRAIAREAPRHLKPGGYLALEIGAGQGAAVRRLLEQSGFDALAVRKDLQGLDRIVVGKMP